MLTQIDAKRKYRVLSASLALMLAFTPGGVLAYDMPPSGSSTDYQSVEQTVSMDEQQASASAPPPASSGIPPSDAWLAFSDGQTITPPTLSMESSPAPGQTPAPPPQPPQPPVNPEVVGPTPPPPSQPPPQPPVNPVGPTPQPPGNDGPDDPQDDVDIVDARYEITELIAGITSPLRPATHVQFAYNAFTGRTWINGKNDSDQTVFSVEVVGEVRPRDTGIFAIEGGFFMPNGQNKPHSSIIGLSFDAAANSLLIEFRSEGVVQASLTLSIPQGGTPQPRSVEPTDQQLEGMLAGLGRPLTRANKDAAAVLVREGIPLNPVTLRLSSLLMANRLRTDRQNINIALDLFDYGVQAFDYPEAFAGAVSEYRAINNPGPERLVSIYYRRMMRPFYENLNGTYLLNYFNCNIFSAAAISIGRSNGLDVYHLIFNVTMSQKMGQGIFGPPLTVNTAHAVNIVRLATVNGRNYYGIYEPQTNSFIHTFNLSVTAGAEEFRQEVEVYAHIYHPGDFTISSLRYEISANPVVFSENAVVFNAVNNGVPYVRNFVINRYNALLPPVMAQAAVGGIAQYEFYPDAWPVLLRVPPAQNPYLRHTEGRTNIGGAAAAMGADLGAGGAAAAAQPEAYGLAAASGEMSDPAWSSEAQNSFGEDLLARAAAAAGIAPVSPMTVSLDASYGIPSQSALQLSTMNAPGEIAVIAENYGYPASGFMEPSPEPSAIPANDIPLPVFESPEPPAMPGGDNDFPVFESPEPPAGTAPYSLVMNTSGAVLNDDPYELEREFTPVPQAQVAALQNELRAWWQNRNTASEEAAANQYRGELLDMVAAQIYQDYMNDVPDEYLPGDPVSTGPSPSPRPEREVPSFLSGQALIRLRLQDVQQPSALLGDLIGNEQVYLDFEVTFNIEVRADGTTRFTNLAFTIKIKIETSDQDSFFIDLPGATNVV